MVVVQFFELSFRNSRVNKAAIRCFRYTFVYYTLSETPFYEQFGSDIFLVAVVIRFAQHFRAMFNDNVSNIDCTTITHL